MDYLPFIDVQAGLEKYQDIVERYIEEELRNKKGEVHPEAESTALQELRSNPLHSLHQQTLYQEDELLQQYRRTVPRIDLERYTTSDHIGVDTLCAMDSYLRHQELVLERLMPDTLLNQWAINNDFLIAGSGTLQKVIENQESGIYKLNTYREKLQLENESSFIDLQNKWKNCLIDRLNVE